MTNLSKKYIYVFGNQRVFRSFENCFDPKKYIITFISSESSLKPGTMKTKTELLDEFALHHSASQAIEAFVSFGRGSIIGNIEEIAAAFDEIKAEYANCAKAQYIGPSREAATIFCNKSLTYQAFKALNIPAPWTIELSGKSLEEILDEVPQDAPFPLVLKAEDLSGGRGMRYCEDREQLSQAILELRSLGIDKYILSEYVSGVEVTFTVLRLGDTFMRLPASYKNETTPDLTHPDTKVKLSGIFKEFDQYFRHVENVMRQHSISGFFSLQGILLKKDDQYTVTFLEAAPRLTGSTPIMEASLRGCNLFEIMANWISDKTIEYAYESRLAIQYSTYIHDGKETVQKLLEQGWIIEAKYEDLGTVPYTEDATTRIRISFQVDKAELLVPHLETIAEICGNNGYVQEVQEVISWFENTHPGLAAAKAESVLSGDWGEKVRWEFHLSSALPDPSLCSAVFGIPKAQEGFYLTRTERGWELPGGHVEKDESIQETLKREILEEAGYIADRFILYGYRKIISTEPIYGRDGTPYPFPVSYIPHFLIASDHELTHPSGEEVIESKAFSIHDPELRDSKVHNIIEITEKELNRIA